MSMKIAAWNMRQAFSDPARAADAAEAVKKLDADVAILPEAYIEDHIDDCDLSSLKGAGYEDIHVEYDDHYDDRDGRFKQSLLVLSRLAMESWVEKTGVRNSAFMDLKDFDGSPFQVIGVHFDDRRELNRLSTVDTLQASPNTHLDSGTILAGDLNSMHDDTWRAMMLRSRAFGSVAKRLPRERLRSLSTRIHEMAHGATIERLNELGLESADTRRRATIGMGRLALMQIDYIMHSSDLLSENFQVHSQANLSDHLPISARVSRISE